jgi:hypothetical protein
MICEGIPWLRMFGSSFKACRGQTRAKLSPGRKLIVESGRLLSKAWLVSSQLNRGARESQCSIAW